MSLDPLHINLYQLHSQLFTAAVASIDCNIMTDHSSEGAHLFFSFDDSFQLEYFCIEYQHSSHQNYNDQCDNLGFFTWKVFEFTLLNGKRMMENKSPVDFRNLNRNM